MGGRAIAGVAFLPGNLRQFEAVGANLGQRKVGASRALPFQEIQANLRQFKAIRDNLGRYMTIWDNLRQFKTMGSRPIVGVAFSRHFKTIWNNLGQYGGI